MVESESDFESELVSEVVLDPDVELLLVVEAGLVFMFFFEPESVLESVPESMSESVSTLMSMVVFN